MNHLRQHWASLHTASEEKTEWVPIHELKRLREWDRETTPKNMGESSDYLDKLTADIKANGIQTPLGIQYGKNDRKALLGEGNHRLIAGERAGLTHLPARVWRTSTCPDGKPVRGHVVEHDRYGHELHVNADLKPSEIGLSGQAEPPFGHRTAADEHLTNPADGTKDWHHGTPHTFNSFDDERPDDDYDMDSEPDHKHWNTHLGTHWTSLKNTAKHFAKGQYGEYADSGKGHVFTANLGIKNPKHYERESYMDFEAFNHAWSHNESHDPDNIHDDIIHDEPSGSCYSLDQHERGDKVDKIAKQHYMLHHGSANWLSTHPDSYDIAGNFKDRLSKGGHDGVTYGNDSIHEGPVGHTCAITFDNSQIHNLRKESQ